jgi:3-hydroxybutyryl-CoA dehydrogenase
MELKTIGVVGTGTMGRGIAWLAASSGLDVLLYDINEEVLIGAMENLKKLASRASRKSEQPFDPEQFVNDKISPVSNLEHFKQVDFVIEAVFEDLNVKKSVFTSLGDICSSETILATNTSVLSITEIASSAKNPERVIGMHFFNPPYIMPLVEIIRGYYTAEDVIKKTDYLARYMKRSPVLVKKDSAGFIVNRILTAEVLEAIKLLQEGVATKEDIDLAITQGLNHPMGPFALQDMIGIDLLETAMEYFSKELDCIRWQPP